MKRLGLIYGLIFLSLLLYLQRAVFAGDQSRNTDFFVGDSAVQISSATNMPFSFYIGDNLNGVSNPAKTANFTVTGVYVGIGSLALSINNDATTIKTFTLPSVSTPTSFELIYQDETNKINPQTSGNYNYTLNLNPAGVSISGLAVKLELTHQFAQTTCVDGATINEKVKTTEQFVGAAEGQVAIATNLPFTVYIGDDLTGVADPVKSVYFTVTGVYVGSGSLDFKIDSDAVTAKNFLLPNVVNPTAFELIYKDDGNKINPQTAGSYDYILNLNPVGVTISGLGVKMTEAHRYKPPSCGAGFPVEGNLVSATFDTTGTADGPAYNAIHWQGSLGGLSHDQGKVKIQLAASDNSNGPWIYYGSGCVGGLNDWFETSADTSVEIKCFNQFNNKRYFKYKIKICSDDCAVSGSFTPQVDEVVVSWSP